MIKHLLKIAFAVILVIPVPSFAHVAEKDTLQIIHPWADEAEQGADSIVHPTFMNNDEHKEYIIIRADSESAEKIVFLRDKEIVDVITLKPGDILSDEDITVQLKNVKDTLKEGQTISMTLYFQDGTELNFKLGVGQQTMPE